MMRFAMGMLRPVVVLRSTRLQPAAERAVLGGSFLRPVPLLPVTGTQPPACIAAPLLQSAVGAADRIPHDSGDVDSAKPSI